MSTVVVLGRVVELPVVGLHGVGAVDPPLHHDALLFYVVHVPVHHTPAFISLTVLRIRSSMFFLLAVGSGYAVLKEQADGYEFILFFSVCSA